LTANPLRLSDRIILAAIGLLSYFVLSGTLAPMGLLLEPLSSQFEISTSEAARVLSGFTSGNLLGAFLALFILGRVRYRALVLCIYVSAACTLVMLLFADDTRWIWTLLALLGVGFGIGLATAAQLIALTYKEDQRAALLVATDSSFSLAGTVMASLTAYLLLSPIPNLPPWLNAYLAIFLAVLLILMLAFVARYPEVARAEKNWGWIQRMPRPVWASGGALYCYTLGQTSMLLWLPSLLQAGSSDVALGGEVVGRYWFGMFLGQLAAMMLVLVLGRGWVLRFGAVGASVGALAVLLAVSGDQWMIWASLGWGLCNLGVLKMLISLATDCLDNLPDQLVPGLLLMATLGTASSPILTSWLVEGFDPFAAVTLGVTSMFGMLALTLFADRIRLN
jgi:TsgA-like MFS transporter